ncbi:MAG TPA: nitronate monooxygenase [Gammaproteobacteria bacterium]|nr:nitronate monooxygenase [Gammaproteobacteria bacterium]
MNEKNTFNSRFLQHVGIDVPVIGGPMYPCSNPELVAAVSAAGGIGIVQPISLTYVHGYKFREGLQYIRQLTDKPVGMNALIEQSSKTYHRRMAQWIDIALEEGVRFFITSLGKPDWVVKKVHAAGGVVYHDVTERKWAAKGVDGGVDGLIAVNQNAGGHAGSVSREELFDDLLQFDLPIICAGGIATANDFSETLRIGYQGVQMGTRFIATQECTASNAYKEAIIRAQAEDILLNERITGVPVAVIRSPGRQAKDLKAGFLARYMLRSRKMKYLMRTIYALRSIHQLKKSLHEARQKEELWQAGKSVAGIDRIESVGDIIAQFSQVRIELQEVSSYN